MKNQFVKSVCFFVLLKKVGKGMKLFHGARHILHFVFMLCNTNCVFDKRIFLLYSTNRLTLCGSNVTTLYHA